MFHYTAPFDPKKGPYIKAFISMPLSRCSEADAERSKMEIDMLIDSGASRSFINPVIAHEIGLIPIGQEYFLSVTEKVKTNVHIADIEIKTSFPSLWLPTFTLQEFPEKSQWRDGILGRDFLSQVVFEIDGPKRMFQIKEN